MGNESKWGGKRERMKEMVDGKGERPRKGRKRNVRKLR